jgi:hypothetical protein
MNEAFIRVEQIDSRNGIKARLRIHVQTADGPKEKLVTIRRMALTCMKYPTTAHAIKTVLL